MKNDLIEDNLRLVHFIVRKFGKLPKDVYEEYYQEGCYWLILAAQRYDASKGFAFSTFAASYIYNGIRRYRRDCGDDFNGLSIGRNGKDMVAKLHKIAHDNNLDLADNRDYNLALEISGFTDFTMPKINSLDVSIKSDDGNFSSLYDLIPDAKDEFLDGALEQDIDRYLDYIKPRVCENIYKCIDFMLKTYVETGDLNYSQNELAEKLGISQAHISRIKAKGLKLWKEFFS